MTRPNEASKPILKKITLVLLFLVLFGCGENTEIL